MVESRPVSPKSLVLALLRVAPGSQPIKGLCGVGELFGFTGNAVRVAVTRLVARGLAESDERGWYRLTPVSSPWAEFAERWRVGDRRCRKWSGGWLSIWLPKGQARGLRRTSLRASSALGFREGLGGLLVRPDNLAEDCEVTRARAQGLGLEPEAQMFVATDFDADTDRSLRGLWPSRSLAAGCGAVRRDIEQSAERLASMPTERAVVQSFIVGGRAIRVLATDPLLPEAIAEGGPRRELTAAMQRYDTLGRRVWNRFIEAQRLQHAPVHLSLVHGEVG